MPIFQFANCKRLPEGNKEMGMWFAALSVSPSFVWDKSCQIQSSVGAFLLNHQLFIR